MAPQLPERLDHAMCLTYYYHPGAKSRPVQMILSGPTHGATEDVARLESHGVHLTIPCYLFLPGLLRYLSER